MPNRHENLRKFNRTILNPITKLFAGRFFYSLVFHQGRRSGRKYSTPIVATISQDFIYIPLPYGSKTDWLLNVQSKNECVIKIKGRCYSVVNPVIVDRATALPAFSTKLQSAFERAGINQYLQLKIK